MRKDSLLKKLTILLLVGKDTLKKRRELDLRRDQFLRYAEDKAKEIEDSVTKFVLYK